MAGRYALIDFDSEGNVDTVYGEFRVNEETGNPLLEAVDGTLVELGGELDATGNNISNVGVLDIDDARTNELPERTAHDKALQGDGTASSKWRLDDSVFIDDSSLIKLAPGKYESSGLTWPDLDYNEKAIYLEGQGIRATDLWRIDGESGHLIEIAGTDGNFGGVSDMAVYGHYPDGTAVTGNLIHSDGTLIDLLFENLIIRWGFNDLLHISSSASGTRIRNCWIESAGGSCIWLEGGTRAKVSDTHIINAQTNAIRSGVTDSEFSNISCFGGSGPVVREDGSRNSWVNIDVKDHSNDAFLIDGSNNKFANISSFNPSNRGVYISTGGNSLTGVEIESAGGNGIEIASQRNQISNVVFQDINTSASGNYGINISGSYNSVSNVVGQVNTDGTYDLLRIASSFNTVSNIAGTPYTGAWSIEIASGTENVITGLRGVSWSNITDNGTRTLINGWGTNAGDPNTTGQWNGEAAYAGQMEATVWDTSTSPWTPYEAIPDGSGWHAT